eukprot:11394183-Alexandrium_andersonii.AAC.1
MHAMTTACMLTHSRSSTFPPHCLAPLPMAALGWSTSQPLQLQLQLCFAARARLAAGPATKR